MANPEHPVHGLFEAVKNTVAGVSCGCADVFGASEAVEASGYDYLTENEVPGTRGLPSIHGLVADGFTVLTF